MKRCSYCDRAAVAWFTYTGHVWGRRRRRINCTVAACAEHEGCVNWNGMRKLHHESKVEREK